MRDIRKRKVNIKKIPKEIRDKLPYSLKTYKDEYLVEELPFPVQNMLEYYFEREKGLSLDLILDCYPDISDKGDFRSVDNTIELVLEYLKNYLQISPGTYPFDPIFSCNLKKYIQRLDTNVQSMFITNEVKNLIKAISDDLKVKVELLDFNLERASISGLSVEYNFMIKIKVNDAVRSLSLLFS